MTLSSALSLIYNAIRTAFYHGVISCGKGVVFHNGVLYQGSLGENGLYELYSSVFSPNGGVSWYYGTVSHGLVLSASYQRDREFVLLDLPHDFLVWLSDYLLQLPSNRVVSGFVGPVLELPYMNWRDVGTRLKGCIFVRWPNLQPVDVSHVVLNPHDVVDIKNLAKRIENALNAA